MTHEEQIEKLEETIIIQEAQIQNLKEQVNLLKETTQIMSDTKEDLKTIIKLTEKRLKMVYERFLSTKSFFGWWSFKSVGGYKVIEEVADIEKEIQK